MTSWFFRIVKVVCKCIFRGRRFENAWLSHFFLGFFSTLILFALYFLLFLGQLHGSRKHYVFQLGSAKPISGSFRLFRMKICRAVSVVVQRSKMKRNGFGKNSLFLRKIFFFFGGIFNRKYFSKKLIAAFSKTTLLFCFSKQSFLFVSIFPLKNTLFSD